MSIFSFFNGSIVCCVLERGLERVVKCVVVKIIIYNLMDIFLVNGVDIFREKW